MQGFPAETVSGKKVGVIEKISFHGTELFRCNDGLTYTKRPDGKLVQYVQEGAWQEADQADPAPAEDPSKDETPILEPVESSYVEAAIIPEATAISVGNGDETIAGEDAYSEQSLAQVIGTGDAPILEGELDIVVELEGGDGEEAEAPEAA